MSCAVAATPAAAADYPLAAGQAVVGEFQEYITKQGDVFADIARRFDLGYTELAAANPGVDPWLPGVGRKIRVPTRFVLPNAPHQGIVVNLAESRLFYFAAGGDRVETHPIGIGVIGKNTPLGATRVVYKEPNPSWYPPASIRAERPELPAAIPPGPDNPLGAFALRLGWKNYLIHGTNKPDGVGRNVSHGCIRLYPEDIEHLFNAVTVGTVVRTVMQPAVAGWGADGLYVAVYPSKKQIDEIDTERPVSYDPVEGVDPVVKASAGSYAAGVDWAAVKRTAQRRDGVPARVAVRSDYIAAAPSPPPDTAESSARDTVSAEARDAAPAYQQQLTPPYPYAAAPAYPPAAMQPYPAATAEPYPRASARGYSRDATRPEPRAGAASPRRDPAEPYGRNSVMGAYGEDPGYRYERDAEQSYGRAMRWIDRAQQIVAPEPGQPTDLLSER